MHLAESLLTYYVEYRMIGSLILYFYNPDGAHPKAPAFPHRASKTRAKTVAY